MRLPRRWVGEPRVRIGGQGGDHWPSQRAAAHIGQRRFVDHIIGMAGAQQIEEVQAALAAGRAEPGEAVIADLRAESVAGFVPRAGVVDGNPVGGFQAGAQHVAGFAAERILPGDQQAHHLPLGDADADRLQLRHQPRHGDLALVVLCQHETTQLRPKWPLMPGGSGASTVCPSGVSQRSRR